MQFQRDARAVYTGLIIFAFLVVGGCSKAQTGTRERSTAADEQSHRAALAKITRPEIPAALTQANDPVLRDALNKYRAGQYGVACSKLHDVTLQDPANGDVEYLLGACYLLTNDTTAAIRELKAAAALLPHRPDPARLLLAKAFIRRGTDAEARVQLQQIIDAGGPLTAEAKELLRSIQTMH